jgi:hypothetical protein
LVQLLKRKDFKLIALDDASGDSAYRSSPDWQSHDDQAGLEIPPHGELPVRQLNSICR